MHPSPDLLALLALGEQAGTPEERAHVESCAECRAEIADLARAVAAGRGGRPADSALVIPPDRVWHSIRAELGLATGPESGPSGSPGQPAESPASASSPQTAESNGSTSDEPGADPVAAPTGPPPERAATVTHLADARPRSSRGQRSLAALVAAAVALVLGIGLGFGLDRFLAPRQTVLWTAELQAQADFPGSRGEAIVAEDAEGNRTLVVELSSPEPVDGSRAVWLIDRNGQRMRMLGYLNGAEDSWPVPSDLDPRQYPIVDVSKEPPGDPDPRHSTVSIVRGTLNV